MNFIFWPKNQNLTGKQLFFFFGLKRDKKKKNLECRLIEFTPHIPQTLS